MTTVLGSPGSGAGQTTLQGAYDNSAGASPQILLDGVPTPISIQASVSGAVIEIQDVAGNIIFEVDADPDLIVARTGVTIEDAFLNGGSAASLILDDDFTTGGPFVGGGIQSLGTVNYNNAVFVWALLQESKVYQAAAAPGFAAFTLFNALAAIENDGNFDLVQALVLNNGLTHRRITSGTSVCIQTRGLSNAPQTRANVSGAVMTKSTGDTAVSHNPTFSTVLGSTINGGTQRGLHYFQPAQALFGSSAGIESYTAFVAVDVEALPGFGNIVKNALRSNLAAASNTRVINAQGTAQSDFGGQINMTADLVGVTYGASGDWSSGWAGAGFFFEQQNTGAVEQFQKSFPAAGRMLFDWSNDMELNVNAVDGFSLGAQSGANGNQFGNFVTSARTIGVGGDWADFLLTQGGNLTVGGLAMGRVSAWVINSISYASSSGSVADADTLTVGGFPTSSPGVTITERQSLNVIGGRSRHDAAMSFTPRTPGALSAGDNDDYAGLLTATANNGMRHLVRLEGDGGGTSVITGIDAGSAQDGDTFKLVNVSANNVTLGHQDAGSAAANRIISPTGADYVLGADESAEVYYDATDSRWRILYGTGA